MNRAGWIVEQDEKTGSLIVKKDDCEVASLPTEKLVEEFIYSCELLNLNVDDAKKLFTLWAENK